MNIDLKNGDCLEVLKTIESNTVDAIVTDPPYELGFMGNKWDSTGIANNVELWKECLRVLKHGGYLLSFGGTRTYHRMAVGIEDAGFEVRDMIEWIYGSGFPKSHNIGKAVDKLQGNEREVLGEKETKDFSHHKGSMMGKETTIDNKTQITTIIDTKGTSEYEGWGTALKPAHEPICMARKPLAEKTVAENCLKWGTGGINIDESRVSIDPNIDDPRLGGKGEWHIKREQSKDTFSLPPMTMGSSTQGRFPANLIHDNSEEVRACFPESKSSDNNAVVYRRSESDSVNSKGMNTIGKSMGERKGFKDSGNASRFFKSIIYQAKPSKKERNAGCEGLEERFTKTMNGGIGMREHNENEPTAYNQNNHPTVKPIALMEYLINMVTPKGGVVLDPFMGSGTTGCASVKNGFDFIGIDLEDEYIKIATARINYYKVF